jgi:hypothetical protein
MKAMRGPLVLLVVAAAFSIVATIRAADPQTEAQPAPEPPPIVRVYDVTDLVEPPLEAPMYDSARAEPFVRGLFVETYGPIGSGPTMSPVEVRTVTRQQRVDELIKRIEEVVLPDTWKDNGGTVGQIREMDNRLIITQTPANQKLAKALLDQLSEEDSRTVRVEADWVWLPPADAGKLLKPSAKAGSNSALREVDPTALSALPASVRHLHAEMTGRNDQMTYIVSGRERSLVTNVTPIVSTATSSFAPTISTVAGGLGLEVRPMVKSDLGFAVLVLHATFDELGKPRHASAAAVAGVALEPAPATQPAATQPGSIPTAPPGLPTRTAPPVAQSPFNTIGMTVQDVRTTIRVPLGRPVLVSNGTWDLTGAHAETMQLMLIVTVHAPE